MAPAFSVGVWGNNRGNNSPGEDGSGGTDADRTVSRSMSVAIRTEHSDSTGDRRQESLVLRSCGHSRRRCARFWGLENDPLIWVLATGFLVPILSESHGQHPVEAVDLGRPAGSLIARAPTWRLW